MIKTHIEKWIEMTRQIDRIVSKERARILQAGTYFNVQVANDNLYFALAKLRKELSENDSNQ